MGYDPNSGYTAVHVERWPWMDQEGELSEIIQGSTSAIENIKKDLRNIYIQLGLFKLMIFLHNFLI